MNSSFLSEFSWTFLKDSDDISPSDSLIPPKERSLEQLLDFCVLNINKPLGPTSHEVVSHIKKILSIKRAGHSGTLDPNVSGVLVVALGRATRFLSLVSKSKKEYVCIIKFHDLLSEADFKNAIEQFIGNIYQRPPKISSVKRRLRTRNIYSISVHDFIYPYALFTVSCEAGTYIRKLCTDIGEMIGCGAHMYSLRRVRAGSVNEKTSHLDLQTLMDLSLKHDLLKPYCYPPEVLCISYPKCVILSSCIKSLLNGVGIKKKDILCYDVGNLPSTYIAIFSSNGVLLSLGVFMDGFNMQEMESYDQDTVLINPKSVFFSL